MSDVAIKVSNLSKRYRIGLKEELHDTFTGQIISFIKSPFTNFKRLQELSKFSNNGEQEDIIWALKDIDFEVKHGEVLGVIGANGAGKSTLLKVLAQITEPTSGRIEINGRVASLLEVGTGFHPELTGRENVYLNGTILGMKKREIDKKFDEIVEFSGIEKFIDTPVKRYSSGMRVRLAFSVAAFLEPEILLIDEVLAVGDIEFKKKCLGKMGNIAKSGRTVLFVSHQMGAISALCYSVLVINNGKVVFKGDPEKAILQYMHVIRSKYEHNTSLIDRKDRLGSGDLIFTSLELKNKNGNNIDTIRTGEEITLYLNYNIKLPQLKNVDFIIHFKNLFGEILFGCFTKPLNSSISELLPNSIVKCIIPKFPLKPGNYYITIQGKLKTDVLDRIENALEISVIDGMFFNTGCSLDKSLGPLNVMHEWKYIKRS